ncbi:branched-chain amino acid ABC transporter permease [Arthrobacter sp. SD76]|uniref:branched-chain amino acid ABC transporter permease n=1 Tax=Arthrobacter sp. SD76 TaxID=3415007 RepID=UPI003C730983
MSQWFASNFVLIQGTFITLLTVLSIQFPMRMGVLSFAGVGSFGIGGYVCGIAIARFGWTTWPGLLLGIAVSAVVGYLLGLMVQRLTGLYLAMATVAFVLIIGVLAGNGGEFTGGHTGLYGVVGTLNLLHIVLITVLVVALIAWSESGAMGRRVEAVANDPELASSMGIHVARYRRMAFLVSGALGGCAGGMQVLVATTIQPEAVGFHLVVTALTIIIIGGSGSWIGALIGTVIFVWLPLLLAAVGEWRNVVYGVIVVVAAIYLPGGIYSVLKDLFRRYREKPQTRPRQDEVNKVPALLQASEPAGTSATTGSKPQ